ncbi:hypothetical protein QE152_g33329 [Popillia japonica]|uniref:Uncharacterized protein n=1 Tax=Popillia japonica TaxID=7064 RepID=A0AAW1IX70_POPJA
MIDEEIETTFVEDRGKLREEAKKQILVCQEENRKTYNLRRRPARKYSVNDVVAIKRTQQGPGLKLKPKYLGPYEITRVKPKDTYEVVKIGKCDGPISTTTCAEFMKPWAPIDDDTSHM